MQNIKSLKARDTILETIKKHKMFKPGDHIIIGLSGGPDSLCLFDVLLKARESLGIELEAVHVNHKFRPNDAEEDQKFVEDYCRTRGISCNSFEIDCNKLAIENGLTSEEAGRKARYDSFALVADAVSVMGTDKENIKIVVAHNRNDQAETILFRIIRGTGTEGLTGMEYKYEGAAGYEIVRPLLDTDRSEVMAYCVECGLSPRMDATNEEAIYGRNKIRLKVIPGIDEVMGSDVTRAILRLRDIAVEDKIYMNHQTDAAFDEVLMEDRLDGRLMLDRRALADMDDAMRHRVVLKAFRQIGLEKDIARVHLLAADGLIASDEASAKIDFPKGYVMRSSYDSIWVQYEGKDSVQDIFDRLAEKFGIDQQAEKDGVRPEGIIPERTAGYNEDDEKYHEPEKQTILRARIIDIDDYNSNKPQSEERLIEQDASLTGDPKELFKRTAAFDAEKVFSAPADEITTNNITHMGDSAEPQLSTQITALGLTRTITARKRKEGDFINLNVGRKSLQDLFVDMKVPRRMRDDITVVACGGEVYWIPDIPDGSSERFTGISSLGAGGGGGRMRFAEKYSVSDETRRVLLLEMLYEL